jgi:hypothetical protein
MSIGIDLENGAPPSSPASAGGALAGKKRSAPALVRDALQKGNPRTLRRFSCISPV